MSANFIPDDLYKNILESMPICTVDIIFLNQTKDKILLCKRNNEPAKDVYYTNGGRWFRNESLLECAVRQAKRELGLIIDPKKTFYTGMMEEHWDTSFLGTSYDNIDVFYTYILSEEEIQKIHFDGQHSDHKWFKINDSNLHPNIKERIRQILLV